jgi:iron(III) transport system permease protein
MAVSSRAISFRTAIAQPERWRGLFTQENIVTTAVALLVGAAVFLPLFALIVASFRVLDEMGFSAQWGFGNYEQILQHPTLRGAFFNTIVISVGATAISTVLGVSLAWLNARTNFPWREKLEPFNLIPYFLSPFVGAIAWHNLASPDVGLLNNLWRWATGSTEHILNVDNIWGVIWVTAIFHAPLVYLFVVGSLRRMDPSLEDCARTTGAGLLRTTLTVTLPLVTPAILSGVIICLVTSAGEFGVPFKLGAPYGYPTYTTEIFTAAVGDDANYQLGAAMAMTLGIITAGLIYIQRRIIMPRQYTTVTGKGFRPNLIDLGGWRWVALGYNLSFIFVAVVMPLVTLVLVSLHRVWQGYLIPEQMSLWNYKKILFFWWPESIDAATNGIGNSLILAFAGATLAMILAIVMSFMIHRRKGPGSALLDYLCVIPIGFPGIVLAMGVLITYIKTPIYATLWILLLGYVTRFFPYGQRNVSAVLMAVSEELDQSSRMSGASWLTTIRRITLPLLKPGIFAGWVLLFIIFLRELPISIILYTAGTETLSVGIYYLQEFENEALTCALSVVQTVLLLACVYAFRRAAGKEALSA